MVEQMMKLLLKEIPNAFNDCDLIPNVLASVGKPDLSTTVFGKKIDMPLFLSPTAYAKTLSP
jgi:L-lactate dehydrogenase (cytochrome)